MDKHVSRQTDESPNECRNAIPTPYNGRQNRCLFLGDKLDRRGRWYCDFAKPPCPFLENPTLLEKIPMSSRKFFTCKKKGTTTDLML